jgi:transposase
MIPVKKYRQSRHNPAYTKGLPHAKAVTTADGGYRGEKFASSVKEILGAEVQVVRRNDLHSFAVIPQRWVVERSFAWSEKCRRLWKNCE